MCQVSTFKLRSADRWRAEQLIMVLVDFIFNLATPDTQGAFKGGRQQKNTCPGDQNEGRLCSRGTDQAQTGEGKQTTFMKGVIRKPIWCLCNLT